MTRGFVRRKYPRTVRRNERCGGRVTVAWDIVVMVNPLRIGP
jgi:hypothetical protein